MKFIIKQSFKTPHHGGKLSGYNGIVLHHTAGGNYGDFAVLNGQTSREVSVHFWIPDYADDNQYDKDGTFIIWQFLPLDTKGWHAGVAKDGLGNSHTIGIELGNLGTLSDKFEKEQLEALDFLIKHIDRAKGKKAPIYSHAEVALPKGRKSDPNPTTFPWLNNYKTYRSYHKPVTPAPKPKPPTPKPFAMTRQLYARIPMMKGADVKAVQIKVGIAKKYQDGIFGLGTRKQVIAWQKAHGLKADGVVGKNTCRAMGFIWKG